MYKLAKYYLVYGPYNKLFKSNIVCSNNILFDEAESFGEDLLFVFSYLLKCTSISYIPKATYYYYDNPGTLLHRYRENRFENSMKINGAVRKFFEEHDCFTHEMRIEWAQRIWEDGYHSIMDLYSFERQFSTKLVYKRTKYIITHPIFREACLFANTALYPSKYVRMIKKSRYKLFYHIRMLAFKMKNNKGG